MNVYLSVLLTAQEHKGNTLRLPFSPMTPTAATTAATEGRNLQADTECGLVLTVLVTKVLCASGYRPLGEKALDLLEVVCRNGEPPTPKHTKPGSSMS